MYNAYKLRSDLKSDTTLYNIKYEPKNVETQLKHSYLLL